MTRRPSRRRTPRRGASQAAAAAKPQSRSRPLAIGALAVTAAAIAGYWIWTANGPSGSGAPMATVAVPALDGAALEGASAYETYCQECHGESAAGADGFGPPLVHRLYVPGHHPDAAFFNAAANGVRAHHWPFGDMPPVEGVTEPEIGVIVAYVRALQQANGIP